MLPSDEEVLKRVDCFAKIFEKYSQGKDDNDEGLDMDDWIAIAKAENSDQEMDDDEYDEKEIDTEVEALEDENELDPDDYEKQLELVQNMHTSREDQFKRLTYWFDSDFIKQMKDAYSARIRELEQQNLPYFNL